MITQTAMLVGLVIFFAIISNAYCLWSNIVERRKWKEKMKHRNQELEKCKMELKAERSHRRI